MEYLEKALRATQATYFADTGYLARPWLISFGDNVVLAIWLVLLWVTSDTHTIDFFDIYINLKLRQKILWACKKFL